MPSRLSQAFSLARLAARQPAALTAFTRWRPFSVTSFEMARALRAQGLRPSLVVDGGANVGQFARAMAETFPEARVVSFEPLPEAAAAYRGALVGEPRVRLVEAALGAEPGTVTFHRQAYSLSSSVLPPADAATHTTTLEVAVTTLDAALADETIPPDTLVKLDLQGYEMEALRGAPTVLCQARHVLLETAFRSSYRGEARFEDLQVLLAGYGYRFLRPIDILRDGSGEIVQMDALFERTD